MAWLERQLNDAAKGGIILSIADIEDQNIQLSNNDDIKKSPELRIIKSMMNSKFDFVQRSTEILIPKQYGIKELPNITISPSRSASVFQPTSFDSEMYLNMALVAQMLRSEIRRNVNSISEEPSLRKLRTMQSYSSLLDILLPETANEYKHDCQEKTGEVHLGSVISYLIDQLKSRLDAF